MAPVILTTLITVGFDESKDKTEGRKQNWLCSTLGSWLPLPVIGHAKFLAQKLCTQRIQWGSTSPRTKPGDEGKTGYVLHWALGSICVESYLTLEPTGSWLLLPVIGHANAASNLPSKVRAHTCHIEQAWFWWKRKSHPNLALKVRVQVCNIKQAWLWY